MTADARPRALLTRPLVAGALLLAAYVALSLLMDPGAYLGTDTGAKVATLDVMDERGTARPVLGYWAERYDPEGRLHPIFDSRPVEGDWVHVTTLPMLTLGRPLYAVGGYRLALLLPMFGGVGAAFAARSLARRSAGDDVGWRTFWIVGLLSPVVVYALDFWEHAPGVACIVGAVALLAEVLDGAPVRLRSLAAGALLGVAATMRTEAFVYSLVAVGVGGLALLVQDRAATRALPLGVLAVAGFAGPWLLNQLLEAQLGGNSRSARVSSAATGGLDRFDDRAREAAITLLSVRSVDLREVLVVGGLLAALLLGAVLLAQAGRSDVVLPLLGLAAAIHLATVAGGLGFVPGLLAAAPIAAAGIVGAIRTSGERYVRAVALVALPVVWSFQLIGGAGPQWGGRYTLPSCILLVTLGAIALAGSAPPLQRGFVLLSVLVTVAGLAWVAQRTHEVDAMFDELVDRPEDVIIARNGFLIREGGPKYGDRLWLTAVSDRDLERAIEVVESSGHATFGVLDEFEEAPASLHDGELRSTTSYEAAGHTFYVHSYAL